MAVQLSFPFVLKCNVRIRRNFYRCLCISYVVFRRQKTATKKKWNFLEHNGPLFAAAYEPLPKHVNLVYDGSEIPLSVPAEEMATFYAKMLEREYVRKERFNSNFFNDWRKLMSEGEQNMITDFGKCDFSKINRYLIEKAEEKKSKSKEEKQAIKEENQKLVDEYGYCVIDGRREKIANFRIEPPGLFQGRGEHPKMGMLKKRIEPEDITVNCSKDSKIPVAPSGHKWKKIMHDNTVTWLACWRENISNNNKYVFLNASSKIKCDSDLNKYEIARKLRKCVKKIRAQYLEDGKSTHIKVRQRAVAMYFIDKLALRAGNEKDDDEADTVGCCSLRVEHLQLHETKDDIPFVVVFDFIGKDCIRYCNEVPVEKWVFENLKDFCKDKGSNEEIFDKLNPPYLNRYLQELMPGLTTRVFRTYNASITLQTQLNKFTSSKGSESEKLLQYNRANREVAVLCNHQRSVPKTFEKSMCNLKERIVMKEKQMKELQKEVKKAARDETSNTARIKKRLESKKKKILKLKEQISTLKILETEKEENKTVALGTSKLNYSDPRITISWCRKYEVPVEKVYNKTQRERFQWAIDSVEDNFKF